MSNIRFRRFPDLTHGGWELDCFVLPTDETNGELVHYTTKKVVQFVAIVEPGLYAELDRLMTALQAEDIPKDAVRLVLGSLKDGRRTHYPLRAADQYGAGSAPGKVWRLVNAVFAKRAEGLQ